MATNWLDRVPTYPGRWKITKSNGSIEYVTMERADEPTVAGTPLNAANMNALEQAVVSAQSAATTAQTTANNANTTANTANTTANNAMPKSGGTFTGVVTLKGDPTANLHPATKQYVDGQKVLLWTNASPSSSFASQTVSVNLSSYSLVLIEFRMVASEDVRVSSVTEKGTSGRAFTMHNDRKTRTYAVTTSGIAFNDGYSGGLNATCSVDNSAMTPYRIYGIK